MKSYLLLFTLLFAVVAFSQSPSVEKAKDALESGKYYEAADLAVKAYEKISPRGDKALVTKAQLAYEAAYAYEMSFNIEKSIEWYQRAIDLKHYNNNPYVYFRIAGEYKKQGKYDLAKANYEEFLKLVPGDEQAKNALISLDKATMMKDNRTRYTVQSESKINDIGMDMAPALANRKGDAIVFGSSRPSELGGGKDPITGDGYFNIWEVAKDRSGNWQAPHLIEGDSINTEHSEGTLVFDGRFKSIYFTRCPTIKKQDLGCQIWTAAKKGKGFEIPVKLPLAPHDSISVGHPLPNETGTALIFSSDMPGGHGGKDLWYAEFDKRTKEWSTPINLGPEINTPGDELFPTFALNGDLFFASDGREGMGGLDIYRATKTDDPKVFKNAKNMGNPINSDADDYHFLEVDSKNGFFTSNRQGSKGNNGLPDIWSYVLPDNTFDLKIIVSEIGGDTKIEGVKVQVSGGGESLTGTTNARGVVYWDKKPNGDRIIKENSDYQIKLLPIEGYHESDNVETFTTKGLEFDQNFVLEMSLLPKTPIVLPEVRYNLGSAELQVIEGEINSKDSLNYVYELLQEYPGMVLKLISHSDSRGSAKTNEVLAQKRAQACIDYLVNEKGVNPKRLVPVGKGASQPRTVYLQNGNYYASKPEEGEFETVKLDANYINKFKADKDVFELLHQFNRRTEAEVVRMDFTDNK